MRFGFARVLIKQRGPRKEPAPPSPPQRGMERRLSGGGPPVESDAVRQRLHANPYAPAKARLRV